MIVKLRTSRRLGSSSTRLATYHVTHRCQVVIEATKGDSEDGYVAVDTVMLQDQFSECATRPAEADPGANTTPAPAVLTNCDFEAGLCGSVVSIV